MAPPCPAQVFGRHKLFCPTQPSVSPPSYHLPALAALGPPWGPGPWVLMGTLVKSVMPVVMLPGGAPGDQHTLCGASVCQAP